MLKFYLPFLYFFKVHARTLPRMISWFLIYTVPVIAISMFSVDYQFSEYVVLLLCLISITYTVYEIGYIYNDAETIKSENNPTLRLSSDELSYYERYKYLIYVTRAVAVLFVLLVTNCVYELSVVDNLFLVAQIVFLLLIYFWYNNTRSKLNIIIAIMLGWMRYSLAPVFLCFYINKDLIYVVAFISLIIFPLVNTVTWLTKSKYGIAFALKYLSNHDLVRILYYSFLSILLFIINIYYSESFLRFFLYLSLYYLSIRLTYYFILSGDNPIQRSVSYARKLKYYSK